MKVVLDTNVLLIAVSRKSRFHKIFSSLVDGEYTICITDDILFEYEEILKKYLDGVVAESIMEIFENAQNVIWINKYFKWNLITEDPDDNKFVDCAIA
ncbi:putative toxin-antitoxin system toxin component, PIN family [Chryseobacterium suipulveris]|uniref:Toxin-antitoxin system toxin component, PIN family n=1 Tax=Chryseobacterium suipulveris TaxID=2929800 RepID=A0ABY4BT14_9FLAO|nr:putative toxin-antitoxin system toxin component, PIN family [Chryseobacterium suipulveris]UOE40856.1 putative toxin-antitoxin system toxin component, PIN family [Chryseobacterium suipulveris]